MRPEELPLATRKKAASKKTEADAPAKKGAETEAAPAAAPAPAAEAAKERVIFPREVYSEHKDAIKAPLKELGLKWQFLGAGKGRYHGEGVQVFVQQSDEGADFTVRGSDANAVRAILSEWRRVAGAGVVAEAKESAAQAAKEEKREAVSEAMRLWELARPLKRPGEPEGFFRRRVAEWEATRPQ